MAVELGAAKLNVLRQLRISGKQILQTIIKVHATFLRVMCPDFDLGGYLSGH